MVSGNGPVKPERIAEGMYRCGHWNVRDLCLDPLVDPWLDPAAWERDFETSGVCDDPEQAVTKLRLRERPEKYFVSFVEIRRADQPRDGGWRWHKWGEYIGDKAPQAEYLHDEPDIERVFTFSVYEVK